MVNEDIYVILRVIRYYFPSFQHLQAVYLPISDSMTDGDNRNFKRHLILLIESSKF